LSKLNIYTDASCAAKVEKQSVIDISDVDDDKTFRPSRLSTAVWSVLYIEQFPLTAWLNFTEIS